jgi:hypothetical protein
MAKSNNHKNSTIPTHLEDDVLIAYLDGELPNEEKAGVCKHLEDCWACRGSLKIIQDCIDNFMIQRQEILLPPELPPTEPALILFQERLEKYKSQSNAISVLSFSSWIKKLNISGYFAQFSSFVSGSSPISVRIGIALIAVVVIVALFFNQTAAPIVSAAELLSNTDEAQRKALTGSPDPVIHQKIQVRRTRNNAQVESVNWETWADSNTNSFREAVEEGGSRHFIADKYALHTTESTSVSKTRPVLLDELNHILRQNRMNPQNPLSSASFKAWRDSLKEKDEEVTKTSSNDGDKSFELKVTPRGEFGNGQITQAAYSVRADSWSPLELRLEVRAPDGILSFEIIPQKTEILARHQLSPEIFPNIPVAITPTPSEFPTENPTPTASPETELAKNENTNSSTPQVAPTSNSQKAQPASAELEVEVLDLLNQAKADLGEQITIKRESDGLLYVRGIVDSSNRKNEILSILRTVRDNPAVRVEIKTIDEAVAEQTKTPIPSGTPERLDSQGSETAADSELLKYFKSEQEARSFSRQMVSRSGRAMSRVYALKRMMEQFNPDELRRLSPEARAKWINLVNLHARTFREETQRIREELQPIFDGPNVGGGTSVDVKNITDVPGAVQALLDLAAANNYVIRSAFTLSSGNTRFSPIKTVQFWQSLRNAEALAAKLESIK